MPILDSQMFTSALWLLLSKPHKTRPIFGAIGYNSVSVVNI